MAYIAKSKSNCWGTPKHLHDALNAEFGFDFDPSPYPRPKWDGLTISWGKSNFVNPPYSDIAPWAKKCRTEQLLGKKSVLLIPARTDTGYFHEYILPFAKIRFLRGRLKFQSLDKKSKSTSAPFPSIICIFNIA